jgi:hypothetical protein
MNSDQASYLPIMYNKDRSLPDFIIAGAAKCATTALAVNLSKHPSAFMAVPDRPSREPHFFNFQWSKGLDWYRSLFTEPTKLQGEKTPSYFTSVRALKRMVMVVPDAKIILSLRNPADRAYSEWNHFNARTARSGERGWQIMPFANAITQWHNPAMISLIQTGHYAEHIKRLLQFYPRERVYVVISERLRNNREEEYGKLLKFLGLGPSPLPFEDHHIRKYKEPLDPAMRAKLNEYFQRHNAELARLLGDPLPEWQ